LLGLVARLFLAFVRIGTPWEEVRLWRLWLLLHTKSIVIWWNTFLQCVN